MFRRTRIKQVAIVLLTVLPFYGSTQSLDNDLLAIGKQLDSASSVSLKAEIEVFSQKGGSKTFETTASTKQYGTTTLTVLDDIEYYTDGKYTMTVDHEQKRVAVIASDKKAQQAQADLSKVDIKKLRKMINEESGVKPVIKLIGDQSGIKTYSITNIPGVDEIKMVLNMTKKSIVSIDYKYAQNSDYKGQYITIRYVVFDLNADIANTLSRGNFFTVENGNVTLKGKYKSYELYSEL